MTEEELTIWLLLYFFGKDCIMKDKVSKVIEDHPIITTALFCGALVVISVAVPIQMISQGVYEGNMRTVNHLLKMM
jgi:hypothetical protein